LEYFVKDEADFTGRFWTASDIEKSLTVQKDGQQVEEWLELANGCKLTENFILSPEHGN